MNTTMFGKTLVLAALLNLIITVEAGDYPQGFRPASVAARLRRRDIYTGSHAAPAQKKTLAQLPTSLDWCDRDGTSFCTSSWNQHIPQYCGSCYIHGALAAANDRLKIKLGAHHDLLLARQVILNCGPKHGLGAGCDGGDSFDIFEYMYRYGLPDESCANYVAKASDKCEAIDVCANCMPVGEDIKVTQCWAVKKPILYYATEYGRISGEEAIMSEIEAGGPVTCGFASVDDFDYNYRGGIYYDKTNATDVNHDVEVVGWGEENGVKFWKARNSWGTYWGENSFFRIVRGVNNMQFESDCTFVRVSTNSLEKVISGEIAGSMYGLVDAHPVAKDPVAFADSNTISESMNMNLSASITRTEDGIVEKIEKKIETVKVKDAEATTNENQNQKQNQNNGFDAFIPDIAKQFMKQGQSFAANANANTGANVDANVGANFKLDAAANVNANASASANWQYLARQYQELVQSYANAYKQAYAKGVSDAQTEFASKSAETRASSPVDSKTLFDSTSLSSLPHSSSSSSSSATNPGGFDYGSFVPSSGGAASPFIKSYGNVGSEFKSSQDEFAKQYVKPGSYGSEYSAQFRGGAGADDKKHGTRKKQTTKHAHAQSTSHASKTSESGYADAADYTKYTGGFGAGAGAGANAKFGKLGFKAGAEAGAKIGASSSASAGAGAGAGFDFSKFIKGSPATSGGSSPFDYSKFISKGASAGKGQGAGAGAGASPFDYSKFVPGAGAGASSSSLFESDGDKGKGKDKDKAGEGNDDDATWNAMVNDYKKLSNEYKDAYQHYASGVSASANAGAEAGVSAAADSVSLSESMSMPLSSSSSSFVSFLFAVFGVLAIMIAVVAALKHKIRSRYESI